MSSCTPSIWPCVLRALTNDAIVRRSASALLLVVSLLMQQADAQTFVQLTDLGSNLGPRLTAAVARQRLNRHLFGAIGTKVTFIDHGVVYQLASDPDWSRILVGRKDEWIHEYDNNIGPGGKVFQPRGIDISARKYFYVADPPKGSILVAEFSPTAKNLVNPAVWTSPQFARPVDVAWDGRTTPLTVDYLYVIDDSLARLSYWNRPALLWTYGSSGAGVDQFSRPSGVCVGKTAAANGGTQFTNYLYVVDRGNRRIVWLNRGDNGPTWLGTASLPDWDPTDCAVDHFGNLYVINEGSHQLHKFTYSLVLLASYGVYGMGATNYNTFAWPHAISVPCGLKVVNGQTVWYCEGRVITAEQWSDSSGAVEHYLGIAGSLTGGPDTSGGVATFSYRVTDHAYQTIFLYNESGQLVHEWYRGLMPPGDHSWFWGGSGYPEGYYAFRVRAVSAYGCTSDPSWCSQHMSTPTFWNPSGVPPPPPPPPPPCDPDCISPPVPDEAAPPTLFLRQRVFIEARPLARIAGAAASAPNASVTTPSGSLTELVRQYGVRGLSFGIPRSGSRALVAIRIYSIAGRPVRALVNEALEPGYYEIAWDGLDDNGRPAGPGVYFAVLTAGGQRVIQRLILRESR